MILPDKDTTITQSYIGLSALILKILGGKEMSFEEIWEEFKGKYIESKKLKRPPTLQKILMVIHFMYMVGYISYRGDKVFNENLKHKN